MKIVLGGQTGVDRAALDTAALLGISIGGWAPRNWQTSDGPNPDLADLGFKEHPGGYRERTIANIRDSGGTLVLATAFGSPGTRLTINEAKRQLKPLLMVDLHLYEPDVQAVIEWVGQNKLKVLNIAGNRETATNGIYKLACYFLEEVFYDLKG